LVLFRQVIKKLAVRHKFHRLQDPAHLRDLLAIYGRKGRREVWREGRREGVRTLEQLHRCVRFFYLWKRAGKKRRRLP